jgi:hypothetical protein
MESSSSIFVYSLESATYNLRRQILQHIQTLLRHVIRLGGGHAWHGQSICVTHGKFAVDK